MVTETRQTLLIALQGCDGGLNVMPCPPSVPKKHRFQGGLIYSPMMEIEGRVLAPAGLSGRRMRIWLNQLQAWHFSRHAPAYIGDLYDRTDERPGGGLEASLYIPKDAWLTALTCLSTIWDRLELTGADGHGDSVRLLSFSFSSHGPLSL